MSDGGASGKGGLPAGWAWAKLGDFSELGGGLTKNGAQRTQSKSRAPLVSVAALRDGYFDFEEVSEIGLLAEDGDRGTLETGDLLIVEGNGSLEHIGRSAIWNRESSNIRHQNHLIRIRAKTVGTDYIRHWMVSADGRSALRSQAVSASGLYSLSLGKVSALLLPIAPMMEQRRIVAKLDDLLGRSRRAKEALAEIPALLERCRQSVLAAAFRGDLTADWRAKHPDVEPASELLKRIRVERRRRWEEAELARLTAKGKTPTDEKWKERYEEPSQPDGIDGTFLPAGWLWTSMETVGDVHLGRQRAPQYQTGEHTRPYLRVANIKDDRIDSSDVNSMDFDPEDFEHYRLLPGDILLSEGQSPELVGQSAIYEGGIEGLCFQKTLHRFRRYGSAPSARFAQLVFRHYVRSGFFRSVASLTVNIAHLTLVRLKPLAFPLPPFEEQKVIERRLTQAMRQIDALEATADQELERLHGVERSILTRAFRGELVPQDPNDEPASVLLDRIRAERAAAPAPRTRGRKTTRED